MRLICLMTAAVLLFAPWTEARAEPQVLALLATGEATPLTCADGECFAEFTAFCIEPERKSPYHLTDYRLIKGADDIDLVAETAGGVPVAAPAARHLRFTSVRGFAAVRVSIDESIVREHGAARVSLGVGRRVALAPVPSSTYRRPHEPGEIAQAAGPRRARGEMIVDRGGVPRQIAAIANRLINVLPEIGKVAEARHQGFWRAAVTAKEAGRYSPRAVAAARKGYESCLDSMANNKEYTLRRCLGRFHDQHIWTLTQRYWSGLPGS
ncbi:MAG: hypothetical protein QGI63_11165 [Rhodospirillales bacterium]|jgi:hypothetical protein|nr:hypothetical protein [Rhodospirillales bacterium]MDP6774823.1 hypothetical protein [Rhodospirillales bacterium]